MKSREEWEHGLKVRSEVLDHILAHDLTNYLNIIQGHTELLLADVEDAGIADRLGTIKRQTIAANAMLQTIGGITRGSVPTDFHGIDIVEIVSSEADRLRSAYPDANLTTDIVDDIRVQADELLLSVFANLMENAIKHNGSSAPIVHVTASVSDGMAIISVEDDGPGLPDDVCAQLEGRGIAHPQSGVHIVRFLVEKYKGGISVVTSSGGTKITVELPVILS